MKELWREIAAFPQYLVSNHGNVQNQKTGTILKPTKNNRGHAKVHLMGYGRAHTRQVNHLVALTFLPKPPREDFISVIHLNGNFMDCVADNLMWRPRFFVVRYHRQFDTPMWKRVKVPLIEINEKKEYKSAQQAAMENGLVLTELLSAAYNKTFVWPTYQHFRTMSDYF